MTKKINISVQREDVADLEEVRAYCKLKKISFSRFIVHSSLKQLRRIQDDVR